MPPKNVLSLWWSRWSAYSEKDARELVRRFEAHCAPLSVLVLDMDWRLQDWSRWDWNRDLFPDPKRFIKWLHKKNFLVTLNAHPQRLPVTDSRFGEYVRRAGKRIDPDTEFICVNMADPTERAVA